MSPEEVSEKRVAPESEEASHIPDTFTTRTDSEGDSDSEVSLIRENIRILEADFTRESSPFSK